MVHVFFNVETDSHMLCHTVQVAPVLSNHLVSRLLIHLEWQIPSRYMCIHTTCICTLCIYLIILSVQSGGGGSGSAGGSVGEDMFKSDPFSNPAPPTVEPTSTGEHRHVNVSGLYCAVLKNSGTSDKGHSE